ncbi:MAG TPA: hypothetical protein VHB97_05075 [Polyangia bacterium]|nr:hypothetical protein [Polyangia bacterium]
MARQHDEERRSVGGGGIGGDGPAMGLHDLARDEQTEPETSRRVLLAAAKGSKMTGRNAGAIGAPSLCTTIVSAA